MKFLENLVSSLGFHQPKFRCWIIGTARIRLAVSFGSGVLAFIAGKAAKEGICLRSWSHPFFLPLPAYQVFHVFFRSYIFRKLVVCIQLQKTGNTDRSLPVVLVLDSSKHLVNVGGCGQPYGDQLDTSDYIYISDEM